VDTVQIVSVVLKPSGFYVITDSLGEQYATKNSLLASLASRFRDKQTAVAIASAAGWHYRDILGIVEAATVTTTGAA
jgi:hypothetical protein